jgi:Family of unknown function (DUF6364)
MSSITIPMPDEDLAFLREWSKEHGTSAEALIAEQAINLRQRLEKPLHPDVAAAIGIISEDADEETYRDYLEKKYL